MYCFLYLVNGNRYEGHWADDLRDGLGRFYHLHTGQLQEGCWKSGICIRSTMSDIIIRQFCHLPTEYPIPPVLWPLKLIYKYLMTYKLNTIHTYE